MPREMQNDAARSMRVALHRLVPSVARCLPDLLGSLGLTPLAGLLGELFPQGRECPRCPRSSRRGGSSATCSPSPAGTTRLSRVDTFSTHLHWRTSRAPAHRCFFLMRKPRTGSRVPPPLVLLSGETRGLLHVDTPRPGVVALSVFRFSLPPGRGGLRVLGMLLRGGGPGCRRRNHGSAGEAGSCGEPSAKPFMEGAW